MYRGSALKYDAYGEYTGFTKSSEQARTRKMCSVALMVSTPLCLFLHERLMYSMRARYEQRGQWCYFQLHWWCDEVEHAISAF